MQTRALPKLYKMQTNLVYQSCRQSLSTLDKVCLSWNWRCSQGKVAHSSSDSELRALAEAAREALWLRKLEYAFSDPTERLSDHADGSARWQRTTQPATKTWEDNRCTIKWVLNPCAHSKVKHIDVPLKALREDVTEFGNLDIEYIDMHDASDG